MISTEVQEEVNLEKPLDIAPPILDQETPQVINEDDQKANEVKEKVEQPKDEDQVMEL